MIDSTKHQTEMIVSGKNARNGWIQLYIVVRSSSSRRWASRHDQKLSSALTPCQDYLIDRILWRVVHGICKADSSLYYTQCAGFSRPSVISYIYVVAFVF